MMTEKLNELQKDVLRTLPNAGPVGKMSRIMPGKALQHFFGGSRHEEASA